MHKGFFSPRHQSSYFITKIGKQQRYIGTNNHIVLYNQYANFILFHYAAFVTLNAINTEVPCVVCNSIFPSNCLTNNSTNLVPNPVPTASVDNCIPTPLSVTSRIIKSPFSFKDNLIFPFLSSGNAYFNEFVINSFTINPIGMAMSTSSSNFSISKAMAT